MLAWHGLTSWNARGIKIRRGVVPGGYVTPPSRRRRYERAQSPPECARRPLGPTPAVNEEARIDFEAGLLSSSNSPGPHRPGEVQACSLPPEIAQSRKFVSYQALDGSTLAFGYMSNPGNCAPGRAVEDMPESRSIRARPITPVFRRSTNAMRPSAAASMARDRLSAVESSTMSNGCRAESFKLCFCSPRTPRQASLKMRFDDLRQSSASLTPKWLQSWNGSIRQACDSCACILPQRITTLSLWNGEPIAATIASYIALSRSSIDRLARLRVETISTVVISRKLARSGSESPVRSFAAPVSASRTSSDSR